MELFIQKMEALLFTKRHYFLIILSTITVIGLILFLSSGIPFFVTLPKEEFSPYITEYIKIGGWVLLVSGILWILLLGSEAEGSLKLEDFLETWGNKEFTRHDFAKFVYGKEIEAKNRKYKRLGGILRNATGYLIEVKGSQGNKIFYKIIEKENKQNSTKKNSKN